MLNLKSLMFIFIFFMWVAHPCFAATTSHIAPKAKQSVQKKQIHKTKQQKTISTKRKAKRTKKVAPKKNYHPQIRSEEEVQSALLERESTPLTSSPSFMSSIEKRIVSFVQKSVETLRYSAYKLGGTKFDTSQGIYVVDCSSYVDNILRSVHPNAFLTLVNATGADKPNTHNYYQFFSRLGDESNRYWNKIEEIEELRPGDILVFRYKNNHGSETGGHVMVVMEKPLLTGEGYLLSVADSAPVGHSQDTRQPHNSGIGIGSLLLKVDPKTGQPAAYAWKVGSAWKKNVSFAMARPTDLLEQQKKWF